MRRVVLQPAGGGPAREHYRDTVDTLVDLHDHVDLLSGHLAPLTQLYPGGRAAMWGATPGKNNHNVTPYNKITAGDYVLFAGHKRLFAGATITHTFRNADLARRLWGHDDKTPPQTWELMFTIDEHRKFDISYAEMNRVVGYKENNNVQGFTVLNEDQSDKLFDLLSLDSDRHPAAPSTPELAELLRKLPKHTEATVTTVRRLEQAVLRKQLLPGDTGTCHLCGDVLPVQFLVAAHIKKRAQCSEKERLDIPTIAMSACKFGCDALYEEGYISVDATGTISISPLAPAGGAAANYLKRISGRACGAFNADRAPYYAWHRNHTYKL